MLKLGVNIDHVATLREARYRGRGFGEPDPWRRRWLCEAAGAHGITAHLREDRRHIQDRDVWELREKIKTRLNLEMANAPEIVAIALKLKPDIVCIVPERRLEVTTEGGLDVAGGRKILDRNAQKNERRRHRGQPVHRAGRNSRSPPARAPAASSSNCTPEQFAEAFPNDPSMERAAGTGTLDCRREDRRTRSV